MASCYPDGPSCRLCSQVDRVSDHGDVAGIAHNDIHVAAELGEHANQAFDGDIAKVPAQQPRHVGLTETHTTGGLGLVQLAFADDLANTGDQASLQEMSLRVGVAEVGE